MRFPSLFRLPKHDRFEYRPRHYDPVKEEIEERTARIKRELGQDANGIDNRHRSRISHGFKVRKKEKVSTSLGLLLLVIAMIGAFYGFVYGSDIVLYASGAVALVYLVLRLKRVI
ncbi:hypothetical protein FUAX_31980 [Fulvitalea axinellae]|uniref:DUF2335 domain-containing protein n=1 Tax=Fulvitalea axinellae TaxID=1182444 RepID=A0AAU9DCA1_9BACT|nr:hypothetical protein FUAX_31980 [Fulvitalea axinellae]